MYVSLIIDSVLCSADPEQGGMQCVQSCDQRSEGGGGPHTLSPGLPSTQWSAQVYPHSVHSAGVREQQPFVSAQHVFTASVWNRCARAGQKVCMHVSEGVCLCSHFYLPSCERVSL